MNQYNRALRRSAIAFIALGVAIAAPACLDRPVAPQQPQTFKLSTRLYRNNAVKKIDLLFMIDNSASMADKQAILAYTVPDLVNRLVNPICVNPETGKAAPQQPASPDAPCLNPAQEQREFTPIKDIHIGVITSSIGGHGSSLCQGNEREKDMAHFIERDASFAPVATFEGKGFLNWDTREPDPQKPAPEVGDLVAQFTDIVRGAGEDGCGFEANLEAWYRFLVDPAPYEKMERGPCDEADTGNRCSFPQGIDQVVLTQRSEFLRQDSLLAVIMLSDENDCSLMDGRQDFVALERNFDMPSGTPECKDDPWSDSCTSSGAALPKADDALNLRCWEQKRRFGRNFLQPIRRYVDALSKPRFGDDDDIFAPLNPAFCSEIIEGERGGKKTYNCKYAPRDPSLVFLGAITGVPWQDIAVDPADLTKGYRPVEQFSWNRAKFEEQGVEPPSWAEPNTTLWDVILGATEDDAGSRYYREIRPDKAPLDPLMVESVDPRTGVNPATGAALATASTPPGTAGANPINGFEWQVGAAREDLQYACIFDLPEPINCDGNPNPGCDCKSAKENPLCYDTSTGSFGTMQYRAKAYPGRRQLAVLKGLDQQAIVASICPANVRDDDPSEPGVQVPNDLDWGYRPAMAAIVDRLKGALPGTCWDQVLEPDADGQVPCVVLEAAGAPARDENSKPLCPPCASPRLEPTGTQQAALASDPTFIANGLDCVCQIPQLTGSELQSCVRESSPQNIEGWCYVDATKDPQADQAILAECPSNQRRLIRFVGRDIPETGSLTFLQCRASSLGGRN